MKKMLRQIPIIRSLDNFTNTALGRSTTLLAVVVAIWLVLLWRSL